DPRPRLPLPPPGGRRTGPARPSPRTDAMTAAGERLVLVVDDEPPVLRFLRTTLAANGYRVVEATTGAQGLIEASTRSPDIVLLDLGLPDLDGMEVTRRLREWSTRPIIVLSARGREDDKVRPLDAGADDYLTKPFGVPELLARMRVAFRNADRRLGDAGEAALEVGDLRIDLGARRVVRAGKDAPPPRTGGNLLAPLVKHAGKVVTHRQLLREVWGPGTTESHYVRV